MMELVHFLLVLFSSFGVFMTRADQEDGAECIQPRPLGMSDGRLQDSFVSASTEHARYRARDGRLDHYGAWCAGVLDKSQWLQVDLGQVKEVMAVSVQGRMNHSWVTSFFVQFSTDVVTWYCYADKQGSKLLTGNQNGHTWIANVFHPDPILARFIRINPQSWHNSICLRTEVYGCLLSFNETYAVGIPTEGRCYQAVATALPPVGQTTAGPTTPLIQVAVTTIRPRIPSLAKTRSIMILGLYPHRGTSLQYHWDFGNGKTMDTQRQMFWYTYNSPGFYHLSVKASNSISEASHHSTIVIQDEIKGLRFLDEFLAFQSTAIIPWEVQEGTNITFTVDFGDASPLLIMKTSNSGSARRYHVDHTYTGTGRFVVTVSASNLVNPSPTKIDILVFVQDPVTGLNLTVELPHKIKSSAEKAFIAIGESVHARARVDSGTDVTFHFSFGETAINTSETSLAYAYQKTGTYGIRVDAFNRMDVISVAFDLPIIVQTDSAIRGLSIQHGVTPLGDSTAFLLSMDEGTAFLCDWSFGDGHSTETDFSDLMTTIYHTYDAVKAYNVSITCTNRHGVALLASLAWVQIPIGGLVMMTLSQTHVTANTEVLYSISIESGSHVSYNIDFGDGNVIDMILPDIIVGDKTDVVGHTFTIPGTFVASMVAVNRLGNVQAVSNSSVVVQRPIQSLQLTCRSPVKLSDEGVSFKLTIPVDIPEPTNVTCLWTFGDNSTLMRNFHVDQRFQQITIHPFIEPGEYNTSVECNNFVSSAFLTTSIVVHDLLKPVIEVKSNHSLMYASPCFVAGESIALGITSQAFDSSYTWDLGDGNKTRTSENHTRLSFRIPGVYTVKVTVDNFFEQMETIIDITIQSRIAGVQFTASPTTMLSHATHFLINVSVRGTDACYVIDFGEDGHDVILGGESCSEVSESRFIQSESTAMSHGHVYGSEGNFSASLYAYNKVSEFRSSVSLEIWKPVCKVNVIIIDLAKWTIHGAKITFTRSEKRIITGWFEINCLIVERVQIGWKIYKRTSSGEQEINSPPSIHPDEFTSVVTLAPRILSYGTFKLTMSVEITGRDVAAIFGSVSKEETVTLEITASTLVAAIKGGKTIEVGEQVNLELDGSLSHDPDLESGEADPSMTFSWYCRTLKESVNGEPKKYVGCYNMQADPEVSLSQEAIFITNTDDFSPDKTYIYKLKITKDNRKASAEQNVMVVKGAPPRMGISCKLNCDSKLSASDRTAFDAVCLDCRRQVDIDHWWEVLEWTPSGLKPLTDLESHTAAGVREASLVINGDYFTAGESYLVRLTANKPEGFPGTSERNFTVRPNLPPSSGRCDVEPSFGYARVTNFQVTCQGWEDPDVPLWYRFSTDSSGRMTVIYSGGSDNARFLVPTAQKGVNSTVHVAVWIEDSYGLGVDNSLYITVTEAPSGASANVSYSSLMNSIGSIDDVAMQNASESEKVMHLVQSVQLLSGLLNIAGDNGQSQDTSSKETSSSAGKESSSGTVTQGQSVQDNQPAGQQGGQSEQASSVGGAVASAEDGTAEAPTPSPEAIERAQAREGIISKVSDVVFMMTSSNTSTINDLELVTSALKEVTKKPDEMTADAVLLSTDSLVAVAESLKLKSGSKSSPAILKRVSESLLQSVWNIMESVAQPYMIPSSSSNLTKEEEQAILEKATRNVLRILHSIGDAVLASKAVGDPPTVIQVEGIILTLERHDIRTIGNRTFRNQGGQFRLPRGEVLMERLKSVEDHIIDSQLIYFFKNPCKWCKKSEQVTSKIIGLDLKNSKGQILNVSNLREDIDVIVLRDRREDSLPSGEFTIGSAEDGSSTWLHAFNTSSVDVSASVKFMPDAQLGVDWVITLRKDEPPSENNYDLEWTLHPTTTRRTRRDIHNRSKQEQKETSEIFFIPVKLLRPSVGMIFVKVSAHLSTDVDYPDTRKNPNITYHLNILTSSCYFWDGRDGEWKSSGCKVGPETNSTAVQCFCDHLTSFGNQQLSFVPMRVEEKEESALTTGYLQLSKTSEESEHPIVLIAVLVILGIYLIMLVWARREDLKDAIKAKVVHVENSELGGRHRYEITVLTGSRRRAGTSANLYCVLAGDRGETGTIALKDSEMQRFQKSGVDSFLFSSHDHLGNLKSINVWHNNLGRSPSWYLKEIVVRDLANNNAYYFSCDCWLAVEHGDGTVQRILCPEGAEDMTAFTKLFNKAARLTDFHLWLSVFTRPAKSNFTRVQRLTCCLAFLYFAMLLNAIYFDIHGQTDPSSILVELGPIPISLRGVVVGIVSGIVVLPLNVCVVQVFRRARPKEAKTNTSKMPPQKYRPASAVERDNSNVWHNKEGMNFHAPEYKVTESEESFPQSTLELNDPSRAASTVRASSTSLYSDCGSTSPLYIERHSRREVWNDAVASGETGEECEETVVDVTINENVGKAVEGRKLLLPHWCRYVAWIVLLAVSCTAAVFVTLYGFQFENDKASEWLASMLISFLLDAILCQPLQVLMLALFVALVIRRPPCPSEYKSQVDSGAEMDDSSQYHDTFFPSSTPLPIGPPSEDELTKAREIRTREIQMKQVLVDIVLYVLFLMSLCLASYSQRDPQAFYVARTMEDTFLGGAYTGFSLKEADTADIYWRWIETTVIPSLSSTSREWASGCSPQQNYTVDCDMRLVGAARIRQVRVEEGNCKVPSAVRNVIQRCSNFYSFFKEDEGNYSLKWQNTNTSTSNTSIPHPSPWQYQTSTQLGLYPYMGKFSTYSGGGYVVDLRHTSVTYDLVKQLQEHDWIDLRTRAVFVDVATYSAQVNLFGIATFLVEWLPTNGALFFNNVKVARLYANDDALSMVTTVSQIFMAVFVLVFIYSELKKVYKMRSKYVKDPWNWLEVTQILLVFGCVGALYKRSTYTSIAIELMKTNPTSFVSLVQASTWDQLFTYLLGFLVFFATLKLLKLIRFNHTVFLLTRTLAAAASPLVSFSIVFFVFYFAYAIVFYVLYGSKLQEYSNFVTTLESVFNILLGAFDYKAIEENNRELGPLLFSSYMLFMVMLLMNMFLTIIMDCFSEVQADEDLQSDDYNVVDFVMERVTGLLRRRNTVEVENDDSATIHMDYDTEALARPSPAQENLGEGSLPNAAQMGRRSNASQGANVSSAFESEELQFVPQPKRVTLENSEGQDSSSTENALIQFYDFIGKAVDAKQSHNERRVEFDLPYYNSTPSYPVHRRVSPDISATYLHLELALKGVQKRFARVAIDDINEDQVLEVLFRDYVARKYYVPFEEEDTTEARKQEKIKWKYTRHMHDT